MPRMNDVNAITVTNVSKSFVLPHEQRTSLKEHVLHPFAHTSYEVQSALKGVTVSIPQGEFFGILGANGSGKSTLLKIIAGVYRQDEGEVQVNGLLSPFIELGVGFNPELTGRDNIRISSALLGLTRRELNECFDAIVAFSELERFMDQKLKNFSSGMMLRLAYSIAIQVEFDILLLDEVLAVGDVRFQEKCFETFRQIRAAGKTVVFVSHDLASIEQFCDRALLLRTGEVQMVGPARDVCDHYRTLEAAPVNASADAPSA